MSDRTVYETDHAANVARLRQLVTDAGENLVKAANAGDEKVAVHYAGMRDGLLRAIDVLEGRG